MLKGGIKMDKTKEMRIIKRCPVCNWRIMDKITPTTGIIQMKCPKCKQEVQIDLSFRTNRLKYRLAFIK